MSVRAIEVHNGYVDFPEGMPQTLHMGTEASPLTQGEAAQIVVSAVINALALGGTVIAGLFEVIGSVDLTGNFYALRAKAIVNDGITLTGEMYGLKINTQVLGTGTVTGRTDCLRIDMYSEAGSTVGIVHGIFISNYNLGTLSADNYIFIRAQENGTATVRSGLYFKVSTGGIDYFAMLMGVTDAWVVTAPNPTGPLGWIKLQVAGVDRYIQLYSVAP